MVYIWTVSNSRQFCMKLFVWLLNVFKYVFLNIIYGLYGFFFWNVWITRIHNGTLYCFVWLSMNWIILDLEKLQHFWSDKGKVTVLTRKLPSLYGESVEITLTVSLTSSLCTRKSELITANGTVLSYFKLQRDEKKKRKICISCRGRLSFHAGVGIFSCRGR